MAIFDVGRVCKKTRGIDAGKICVVTAKPEKGFTTVIGPNIPKTKVNIKHLEPTPKTVKIDKNTSQPEVTELLKKEGLIR